MSTFADLRRDLLERRLWPLAAVPPLGLLAVVALGGGDPPAAAPPLPAAPASAAAPAETTRELERLTTRRDRDPAAGTAPRGASARDPFTGGQRGRKPPPPEPAPSAPKGEGRKAAAPSAAAIVAAAERAARANAAAVAAAQASSRAKPAPAAPKPAAPASQPVAAPAPDVEATGLVADVRLSPEGEVARARKGVPAGTALPSIRTAELVVRTVERRVVELALRPGTRVTGGRCVPSRRSCRILRVRVGATARLAREAASDGGRVHRVRVLRVRRVTAEGATTGPRSQCFADALGLRSALPAPALVGARWRAAARDCLPGEG